MFDGGKADKKDLFRLFTVIQRYEAAGLPNIEAIRAFSSNNNKEAVKAIMEDIISQMESGNVADFPAAMELYPAFFPNYVIHMIRVGQNAGTISEVLEEINIFLKQDIDMERDINSELWIQKIFIVGICFIFAIAIFFVIPQMGEVLLDAELELPLITRAVLALGDFAVTFWWLIFACLVGGFLYLRKMKKDDPIKYALLKMRLTIFKTIFYYQLQYRFTRIFGLCLKSGVKTVTALEYTASAVDNVLFEQIGKIAAKNHESSGIGISQALRSADVWGIIDPALYIMLDAGSTAISLDEIMLSEANGYSKELSAALKVMGNKIGLSITIPGYAALIILFAALEFPLLTLVESLEKVGL